jgi:hypothetical protein
MPLPPLNGIAAKAIGYQQAVAGTVDAVFIPTIPPGTEYLEVAVGAQDVRWCACGTIPTAGTGMPAKKDTTLIFCLSSLSNLRFISQVPGSTLDITYYSR